MITTEDVIEGGQAARLELLFSPVSFREPYTLHYAEARDTAFWQPPTHPGEAHRICVGGRNAYRAGTDPKKLVQSLVWHELGHALYTERDLVTVNQALQVAGIRFEIFNLFEDARIEHRFREETGLKFGWTDFEDLAKMGPFGGADYLFFRAVQLEGNAPAYQAAIGDWANMSVDPAVVFSFWERAVACKNSLSLIPVLRDWIRAFPEEQAREWNLKKDGLATSLDGQQNGFAPMFEGAIAVQDGQKSERERSGQPRLSGAGASEPGSILATVAESGDLTPFLSPTDTYAIDKEGVRTLARVLRRGLFVEQGRSYSNTPGRRLRAERLVTGKAPYQQLSTEARGLRRNAKVAVVLDCSGSMEDAASGGVQLLAALSELAREGALTGKAVFSKIVDDTAIHAAVRLPVAYEVLRRLAVDGEGEGLEPALRLNRKHLQGHTVFVYSDGQIGDEPIRPQSLHGMNVIGLYCGGEYRRASAEEAMREYFRVTIARSELGDLAHAISKELRR